MISLVEEMRLKVSKILFGKSKSKEENYVSITPTDEEEKFGFFKSSSSKDVSFSSKPPKQHPTPNGIHKNTQLDSSTNTLKREKHYQVSGNSSFNDVKHKLKNNAFPAHTQSLSRKKVPNLDSSFVFSSHSTSYNQGSFGNDYNNRSNNRRTHSDANVENKSGNIQLNRHNSMIKLESWVQQKRVKPSSNFNHYKDFTEKSTNSGILLPNGNSMKSECNLVARNKNPTNRNAVTFASNNDATFLRPKSVQDLNTLKNQTQRAWKSSNPLTPNYDQNKTLMKSQKNVPSYNTTHRERIYRSEQSLKNTGLPIPTMTSPPLYSAAVAVNNGPANVLQQSTKSAKIKNNKAISLQANTDDLFIENAELKIVLEEVDELVNLNESLLREMKQLQGERSRLQLAQRKLAFRPFSEYESQCRLKLSNIRSKKCLITKKDINKQNCESQMIKVTTKLLLALQKLRQGTDTNGLLHSKLMEWKTDRLRRLDKRIDSKKLQFQLEWDLGRIQMGLEKLENLNAKLEKNLALESEPSNHKVFPSVVRKNSRLPSADSKNFGDSTKSRLLQENVCESNSNFLFQKESRIRSTPGRFNFQPTFFPSHTVRSLNRNRSLSASERLFTGSHSNIYTRVDTEKWFRQNTNGRRILNDRISQSSSHLNHQIHLNTLMRVGIDLEMAPETSKQTQTKPELYRMKKNYSVRFDLGQDEPSHNFKINDASLSPKRCPLTDCINCNNRESTGFKSGLTHST